MAGQAPSNWERGSGSGRSRRLIVVAVVATLVVAAVGAVLFGLNSTEFRIVRELSEGSPQTVSTIYYQVAPQERLTITTKSDVTREDAVAFKCETVLPLLAREHLSPQIEIRHPGNDFVVVNEPCP